MTETVTDEVRDTVVMDARNQLVRLLESTAEAHHQAYIATDGFDPGWSEWYARDLQDHGALTWYSRDDLAAALFELSEAAPASEPWAEYYTRRLLDEGVSPPR